VDRPVPRPYYEQPAEARGGVAAAGVARHLEHGGPLGAADAMVGDIDGLIAALGC